MRVSIKFYSLLCVLYLVNDVASQENDGSLIQGGAGDSIVRSTVRRIRNTCVFDNDYNFMRRVAWVESRFGTAANVSSSATSKGIWQVSKAMFDDTKDVASHSSLPALLDNIKKASGIDWKNVTHDISFMGLPLYNALAARIYLANRAKAISPAPADQAPHWVSHYTSLAGATSNMFTNALSSIPLCKSVGTDMLFVLDGSGSITSAGFTSIKNVVYQIVNKTDIGPEKTRVAIIVFDNRVFNSVSFNSLVSSDKAQLLSAINNLNYPSGSTATALALQAARTEFINYARPLSQGYPRVLIVITDGESNDQSSTAIEADKNHKIAWLEGNIYTIGMGPSFVGSSVGLAEITRIASEPKCTHVSTTPSVAQIASLTDELQEIGCQASAPICEGSNCNGTINGAIGSGDNKYFWQRVNSTAGQFYVVSTSACKLVMYASSYGDNPNENFYDYKAEATPGNPGSMFVPPSYLQTASPGNETVVVWSTLVAVADELCKNGTNFTLTDTIPPAPPGAITVTTASMISVTEAKIIWTAASNIVGGWLNYTVVICDKQTGSCQSHVTTQTSFILNGLSNCIEYSVEVWAQNKIGNGPKSKVDINQISIVDVQAHLEHGPSLSTGRLIVKGNRVCPVDFATRDAKVVCRELCGGGAGFLGSVLRADEHFPQGTQGNRVQSPGCIGPESRLSECPSYNKTGPQVSSCRNSDSVGINCFRPTSGQHVINEFLEPRYTSKPECGDNSFKVIIWRLDNELTNGITVFPTGNRQCLDASSSNNGTHMLIEMKYAKCGGTTTAAGQYYHHYHPITIAPAIDGPSHHPVINSGVNCSVYRFGNLEEDIARVNDTVQGPIVTSERNLTVGLELFEDAAYTMQMATPAQDDIGKSLYIRVSLTGSTDAETVLYLTDCIARPSRNDDSFTSTMINESCSVGDTANFIINPDKKRVTFTFQALRFVGRGNGIYLVCKALFCFGGENGAPCNRYCHADQHPKARHLTLRFRMDSLFAQQSDSLGLNQYPLVVNNPIAPEDDKGPGIGEGYQVHGKDGRMYFVKNGVIRLANQDQDGTPEIEVGAIVGIVGGVALVGLAVVAVLGAVLMRSGRLQGWLSKKIKGAANQAGGAQPSEMQASTQF